MEVLTVTASKVASYTDAWIETYKVGTLIAIQSRRILHGCVD